VSTLESRQKIVYWRGIVKKLNESRLSVGDFSKKNKVSPGKLSYWKLRIMRLEKADPFVEVKKSSLATQENQITLSINDVITIHFTTPPSPEWVSELLCSVRRVA